MEKGSGCRSTGSVTGWATRNHWVTGWATRSHSAKDWTTRSRWGTDRASQRHSAKDSQMSPDMSGSKRRRRTLDTPSMRSAG